MKTFRIITACMTVGLTMRAEAMPNPASTFCASMHGRSVLAKLPDGGEISLCHLPNKKIVEEWTLFRMFDGKVPTPDNTPFR